MGITGGIGSGKSMVANIFAHLGVPVYNADVRTRILMNTEPKLISTMKAHFGEAAYINNALNRKHIADIVFNDKLQLKTLNEIVHPFSIADANTWGAQQTTAYVVKESALLFETEAFHHVDYIVGVTAPVALRIHRVMKRDNVTREDVLLKMNNQMQDSIKMKLCNSVIINNEQQLVIPQVLHLHHNFINTSP